MYMYARSEKVPLPIFVINLLTYEAVVYARSEKKGGDRVVRRCWVNFQCQGVLLTWLTVGQGPIVLSVGAGGG